MIYGSAVRCFVHENCWNARIEGGGAEYPAVLQTHTTLEEARAHAERVAHRRWERARTLNVIGALIAGGNLTCDPDSDTASMTTNPNTLRLRFIVPPSVLPPHEVQN